MVSRADQIAAAIVTRASKKIGKMKLHKITIAPRKGLTKLASALTAVRMKR